MSVAPLPDLLAAARHKSPETNLVRHYEIPDDWRKDPWLWNLRRYKLLVQEIEDGYRGSIYEYANDLYYRNALQEKLDDGYVPMESSIEELRQLDERLRVILLPTTSIHGNYPAHYFWFYGVPRNVELFIEEVTSSGMLA